MQRMLSILAVLALGLAAFAGLAQASPGTALAVVPVPVPSPSGIGVSVADDCDGNLYYTNYLSPFLYKITAAGALINTMPLLDASGAQITIGEMAWDDRRKVLWGGSDSQTPNKIYQIDPVTGLCTYQFDGAPGLPLTDGLAFEEDPSGPAGDLVYHSPDVSTSIYVFQAQTGALVRVVTPQDASGNPLSSISGLTVGTGSTLYIGQDGLGQITRVDKVTGAFIGSFASPGGRDEGLECDAVNFLPKLALWSKDAYNNTITAIEVEYGTCACGGVVPTKARTWGSVKALYR